MSGAEQIAEQPSGQAADVQEMPEQGAEQPVQSTEQAIAPEVPSRELVETLREQINRLWSELEARHQEVTELHGLLRSRDERLALLEAGHSQVITTPTEPAQVTPKRHWWQRVLRG